MQQAGMTTRGPDVFSWLPLLCIVNFVSGCFQHLYIFELTATGARIDLQAGVFLVLGVVNVAFGAGAAWSTRQVAPVVGHAAGVAVTLLGSAVLLALAFALSSVQGAFYSTVVLVVGVAPAALVFLLVGWICGSIFSRVVSDGATSLGPMTAASLVSLLAGYLSGNLLGVACGVNACMAALGLSLLLGAASRLAGAPRRVSIAVGVAAASAILALPTDAPLERLRHCSFRNMTQRELDACTSGRIVHLLDRWSNAGKLDIYRLPGSIHVFGCYNYQRVWKLELQSGDNLLAEAYPTVPDGGKVLVVGVGGGRPLQVIPRRLRQGVTAVELNRQVIDFFRANPTLNHGALEGIDVQALDGRTVLDRAQPGTYDLMIFHNLTLGTRIVNALFAFDDLLGTRESMAEALRALKPDGGLLYLTKWPQQADQVARALTSLGAQPLLLESTTSADARKEQLAGGDVSDYLKDTIRLVVLGSAELRSVFLESGDWRVLNPAHPDYRTDDCPPLVNPISLVVKGYGGIRDAPIDVSRAALIVTIAALVALPALVVALPFVRWRPARCEGFDLLTLFRIGAGFTLLQYVFVARFRSLFGDPMETAVLVNATLLVAAALGSTVAHGVRARLRSPLAAVALAALVLAYTHLASGLIPFHTQRAAVRLLACILVVGPMGAMAGTFLPLSLNMAGAAATGTALLLDSLGALCATALFYLIVWAQGISAALGWVALLYLTSVWALFSRPLPASQGASRQTRNPM